MEQHKYSTKKSQYSGTSVVDHNLFEFVRQKPICSRTETFFPIRNNGKDFNLFYPKEKYFKKAQNHLKALARTNVRLSSLTVWFEVMLNAV